MPKSNPISKLVQSYQSKVKSPLGQSLLLAGIGLPAAYMLKRPVNKLLKHLGRDPRINAALGTRPA